MASYLKAKLLYNKYFYISTTVITIILFNFIAFSGVWSNSTSSICLFGEFDIKFEKETLNLIKTLYFLFTLISYGFLSYEFFTKNNKIYLKPSETYLKEETPDELILKIGISKEDNSEVFIHEKGLY